MRPRLLDEPLVSLWRNLQRKCVLLPSVKSSYTHAQFRLQVEVGVGVLWEGTQDSDPAQRRARAQVTSVVQQLINEVQLWQEAAQIKRAAANGSQ